MFNCHIQLTE